MNKKYGFVDIDSHSISWRDTCEWTEQMEALVTKVCERFGLVVDHWESSSKRDIYIAVVFQDPGIPEEQADEFIDFVEAEWDGSF